MTDLQETIAQHQTRIVMLEEGQNRIVQSLSTMQAAEAQSRGEQRQQLEGLMADVKTLVLQAAERNGAEAERRRHETFKEKSDEQTAVWLRWIAPWVVMIFLALGSYAVIQWAESVGFEREQ